MSAYISKKPRFQTSQNLFVDVACHSLSLAAVSPEAVVYDLNCGVFKIQLEIKFSVNA